MTDLKKLLAEATPGPWEADGAAWNRIVCSATNRVCFVAHSDGLNDERDIATSNLIALAPQLAVALLKVRESLAGILEADAKAKPGVWVGLADCIDNDDNAYQSADLDAALNRARASLAEIKDLTGGME